MPVIRLSTFIQAPAAICFDLSRSIELHLQSTAHTKERAVAGRTSGLCEAGDTITWEAIHFGIRQRFTVCITAMDRPSFFEDEMIRGAFKYMHHRHEFEAAGDGTLMKDTFSFAAPCGLVGRLFESLVLTAYMRRLLEKRNQLIKVIAEQQAITS